MMKRMMLLAACLLALAACQKENNPGGGSGGNSSKTLDITGEWSLTGISTKSATIGGQTVSVYVSFTSDNKFELYQMVGQGWYSRFTGSWTLKDKTLSGTYDDGKAWGDSYTVAVEGNKMTLTTSSGNETDTYTKTPIPADVKSKVWER